MFFSTMHQMIMNNVRGHDERTENNHPLNSTERFSIFQFTVLAISLLVHSQLSHQPNFQPQ